jgi:DNA-binding MarR family transcriptional regulator
MALPPDPIPLQVELQQRIPFRSRSQEALIGVAKAASMANRATAKVLARRRLSLAQYNVLRILRGSEPTGLATLAIRERMIDPAAAITRLIDKLEAVGLVSRERGVGDRRQVNCRITGAGLTVLAELDEPVLAIDDRIGKFLSEEDLGRLNSLLERMRAGLR